MVVPELPEKTEFIQAHLKEVGISAENFDCICATDPKTLQPLAGLRTVHSYEYDAPGSGWNVGGKPVALMVSFQMFWKAAMYMNEDYFLFIEYDAHFHPDWLERTEKAMKHLPDDFDFLFLGSCCAKDSPKVHVKGDLYKGYAMCNHAQIIAKKAMPTLLRTQRKFYAPVDIALAFHSFPHLNSYVILPRVADQFNTKLEP